VSPWKLFDVIGRNNISGIGVESFLRGGFIVDSGIYKGKTPKTIVRMPFPKSWKVVLVIPKTNNKVTEEMESEMLIPKEPAKTLQEKILRITFLQILPAVLHKDYFEFVTGLEELERNIGEYYEKIQGGIYSSELGDEIARILRDVGFKGIGQSSWGPSIYGFANSKEELTKGMQIIKKLFEKEEIDVQIIAANPRNSGARVISKD